MKPDVSSSCNYDTRFTTLDLTANLFFFKSQKESENAAQWHEIKFK